MHPLDIAVLAGYFVLTVGAGMWFTRSSARGLRSYFLGDNREKWWMLACSGSATNYSVDGTVWNISMLMVLGMMSWYTTLIWWLPNAVVLMSYSAIWIRRTGAMTSADLNTVRFGDDAGAVAARVGFAVLILTFSVMTLCMSYVVLHKFATTFGFNGHASAMLLMGSTGLYVLFGGFRGVILTDFIQNLLLLTVSFVIGYLCFTQYDAPRLEEALHHPSLTVPQKLDAVQTLRERLAGSPATPARAADLAVLDREEAALRARLEAEPALRAAPASSVRTFRDWMSLSYRARPELGRFADSSYKGWGDFAGAALAWSIVGLIGCFGGAGGRYGEQRYLAAKTPRHAAWQAALWQGLGIPRWVVTAGLAYLAFTVFRGETVEAVKVAGGAVVYSDPDAIFPVFTASNQLAPGVFGLVIATLAAAYMSTFSSEVNAAAAIAVHDIVQPVFRRGTEAARGSMTVSYAVTLLIVVAAMGCGWVFTEHSSLNALFGWMLGGLICCVVVPLALRWYWGRMNGWGFAAGCGVGFLPALVMLSKQFVGAGAWVQRIPDSVFTYAILAVSLAASIAVSLLTAPVDAEHIDRFYRRVRPFGFWRGIRERALASSEPANEPLDVKRIPLNIALGVVASFALYMTPVYVLGHWFVRAAATFAVFLACAVALHFTWYRRLPGN